MPGSSECRNPLVAVTLARMKECIGPDIVATYPTHYQLDQMTTYGSHVTDMLFPCGSTSHGNDVVRLVTTCTPESAVEIHMGSDKNLEEDSESGKESLIPTDVRGIVAANRTATGGFFRDTSSQSAHTPLFILGVYSCTHREEDSVHRHTVQATLCLLLRKPIFSAFIPMLTLIVNQYALSDLNEAEVVRAVYKALTLPMSAQQITTATFPRVDATSSAGAVSDQHETELTEAHEERFVHVHIELPGLPASESIFQLPQAALMVSTSESVHKLLLREIRMLPYLQKLAAKQFMTVWRALTRQRSVVIVGSTAEEVSSFVFACIVWANPVRIPLRMMYPYVASPAIFDSNSESQSHSATTNGSTEKDPRIVGTTNEFFASRHTIGDVILHLATGELWIRPEAQDYVTPTPKDMAVMQRIQQGLNEGKSEEWVSLVLERHTCLVLQSLPSLDALLSRHAGARAAYLQWLSVGHRKLWVGGGFALVVIGLVLIVVAVRFRVRD